MGRARHPCPAVALCEGGAPVTLSAKPWCSRNRQLPALHRKSYFNAENAESAEVLRTDGPCAQSHGHRSATQRSSDNLICSIRLIRKSLARRIDCRPGNGPVHPGIPVFIRAIRDKNDAASRDLGFNFATQHAFTLLHSSFILRSP